MVGWLSFVFNKLGNFAPSLPDVVKLLPVVEVLRSKEEKLKVEESFKNLCRFSRQ